jgi:hypothetical protein
MTKTNAEPTKKPSVKSSIVEEAKARAWVGSEEDAHHKLCTMQTLEIVQGAIHKHILKNVMQDFFIVEDGDSVYIAKTAENTRLEDYDPFFDDASKQDQRPTKIPTILKFFRKPADVALFFDNQLIWYPEKRYDRRANAYLMEWKEVNPVTIWKRLKERPTFNDLKFIPYRHGLQSAKELSRRGTYNTFDGWGCDPLYDEKGGPVPEKCHLIRKHLHNVLCGGDTKTYDWVIQWLAHKVQNPRMKIGTAVGITGGQGCGKGTFIKGVLGRIFSVNHFIHTTDIQQIVGRFTNTENALFTFLDEALFVHDKATTDKLKAIVTETSLQVERKYKDAKTVTSMNDYWFATNNVLAAPLENDDRRYCVLSVKPMNMSRDAKDEYFNALWHEIKNGGAEAFFGFLLQTELSDSINVKRAPITAATDEQKAMNMSHDERWWFSVLDDECFGRNFGPGRQLVLNWENAQIDGMIPRSLIHESYLMYMKGIPNSGHAKNTAELFKRLEQMCPSMQRAPKKPRITPDKSFHLTEIFGADARPHCMDLPDLETCRAQFEEFSHIVKHWHPDDMGLMLEDDDTPTEFVDADERKPKTSDELPF